MRFYISVQNFIYCEISMWSWVHNWKIKKLKWKQNFLAIIIVVVAERISLYSAVPCMSYFVLCPSFAIHFTNFILLINVSINCEVNLTADKRLLISHNEISWKESKISFEVATHAIDCSEQPAVPLIFIAVHFWKVFCNQIKPSIHAFWIIKIDRKIYFWNWSSCSV